MNSRERSRLRKANRLILAGRDALAIRDEAARERALARGVAESALRDKLAACKTADERVAVYKALRESVQRQMDGANAQAAELERRAVGAERLAEARLEAFVEGERELERLRAAVVARDRELRLVGERRDREVAEAVKLAVARECRRLCARLAVRREELNERIGTIDTFRRIFIGVRDHQPHVWSLVAKAQPGAVEAAAMEAPAQAVEQEDAA